MTKYKITHKIELKNKEKSSLVGYEVEDTNGNKEKLGLQSIVRLATSGCIINAMFSIPQCCIKGVGIDIDSLDTIQIYNIKHLK